MKVRDLEWKETEHHFGVALESMPLGAIQYTIDSYVDGVQLFINNKFMGHFKVLGKAKAFAQDHYDNLILSQIKESN
jgi:hypothetical protein